MWNIGVIEAIAQTVPNNNNNKASESPSLRTRFGQTPTPLWNLFAMNAPGLFRVSQTLTLNLYPSQSAAN